MSHSARVAWADGPSPPFRSGGGTGRITGPLVQLSLFSRRTGAGPCSTKSVPAIFRNACHCECRVSSVDCPRNHQWMNSGSGGRLLIRVIEVGTQQPTAVQRLGPASQGAESQQLEGRFDLSLSSFR